MFARVNLDGDELEEARWFSRQQIRDGLADGSLLLPNPISISFRLIETWYDSQPQYRLADSLSEGNTRK